MPASSASSSQGGDHGSGESFGSGSRQRTLGLLRNAMKRKESFIQFFVMTGIFFISLKSLGQKYRISELAEEISVLREERESLSLRVASIKSALLREAAADPSGLVSSHLNRLFRDPSSD
ncbi:hypothetical protein AXF42_Ash015443 [Apostasia shenzhenica]|uniref:Uncharacterized protein n=1 Tax=Apostasia shenzhenica TaxID=1088818 RepID=A0A2H9ZS81_9ASPA|nr:hypothetical protein AXF42_Ash015443 [Apostasia shenzhenica]